MLLRCLPLLLASVSFVGCASSSTEQPGEPSSGEPATQSGEPRPERGEQRQLTVSNTTESDPSLPAEALRAETALERARSLGSAAGSVKVDYAPPADGVYDPNAPDKTTARRVLFEAVTFLPSTSSAGSEITVTGDFPSSAEVVVTNERFEVLATTSTQRSATSGLAEAVVTVPATDGQQLVLVRDMSWVKPMSFEVGVKTRAR